jgi:hypothetical protein
MHENQGHHNNQGPKNKLQHKGIYKKKDNLVIVLFEFCLAFQPRSHIRIHSQNPIVGNMAESLWRRAQRTSCDVQQTIMVCQVMFLRPMRYSGYGASLGCRG